LKFVLRPFLVFFGYRCGTHNGKLGVFYLNCEAVSCCFLLRNGRQQPTSGQRTFRNSSGAQQVEPNIGL
jgi:hypothetical protein